MTKHPVALAIALALSVPVAFSGCDSTANLTEQEHIQRAKDSQDRGDLTTSIIELKNALQKNPDSLEARQYLGRLYLLKQQGYEAEKEFNRALELGGKREVLLPLIGESLLLTRQPQRVLDEVQLGEQMSTRNRARIMQIRGHALMQLRKRSDACGLFEQSLALDSSIPQTYWGLAQCAIAEKEKAKAHALIQKALKLPTEQVRSNLYLADLHLLDGNFAGAQQAFVAALKIAPNDTEVLFNRATFSLSQNNIEAARPDIEKMKTLAPKSIPTLFVTALDHFSQKQYVAARDTLQNLFKVAPDHGPSLFLAGITSQALGTYQQAESYLKRFLNQSPGNVQGRNALALTQIRLKQPDNALETLAPLLRAQDNASALALASEAYQLKNDYKTATSLLEKAILLEPDNAALQTQLGVAHLSVGDTLGALGQLQVAAKLDSGQYDAQSLIVLTDLERQQFERALAGARILVQLEARNPVSHDYMGRALVGKNDRVNARKSFETALALNAGYFPAVNWLARLDILDKTPDAARQRFERFLETNPANIQAMMALAQLAANNKNDAEQVRWLERAIRSNAQAIPPRTALIRYYLDKKDIQRATEVAQEAFRENPDNPVVLNLVGATQLAAGDAAGAAATMTKLAQKIQSADVYLRLAMIRISDKKIQDARVALQKALTINPRHPPSLDTLFRLEVADKQPQAAMKVARQMQVNLPQAASGFVNEGDLQFSLKQPALAAKAYRHALDLQPDSYVLIKLHGALTRAGLMSDADRVLAGWIKSHSGDLVVRSYSAENFIKTKRPQEAIAQYEFILGKVKNNASILNNLASLYQNAADPRAVQTAEAAFKLEPDNPVILDTLGWILVERGQTQRGLALLRKAVAKAPQAASTRYHLAVALARTQNKESARALLTQLLKENPGFPEAASARTLLGQL